MDLFDKGINAWEKRHTVKSLITFLFILNFTYFICISALPSLLDKIFKDLSTENWFLIVCIGISLDILFNFLIYIYWSKCRTIPLQDLNSISIIFAPHTDSECTDLIKKIYEKFCEQILINNYGDIIKCILLTDNIRVRNHDDANKVLYESNAVLVIHGYISSGNIDNNSIEGFKNISFTVRHRNLDEHEINPVLRDIAGAIVFRKFIKTNKNSFIESDIIASNLTEVSLFFISLSLTLNGEINKSIPIAKKLLSGINQKIINNRKDKYLPYFKQSVTSCLVVALDALFYEKYTKYFARNVTKREYDIFARDCDTLLEEIILLNKEYNNYHLRKAIIKFHFNDIRGSISSIKEAIKISGNTDCGPYFSLAFLNLWSDNYNNSLKEYLRATKCSSCSITTVTDVLSFLQNMIEMHPDKLQLLFGLAFVNEYFFDITRAVDDYRKFLETADTHRHKKLIEYSKSRITLYEGLLLN